jgi:hypothetical protein
MSYILSTFISPHDDLVVLGPFNPEKKPVNANLYKESIKSSLFVLRMVVKPNFAESLIRKNPNRKLSLNSHDKFALL